MLLKQAPLEGIRRGDITLAFRRWQKPTVKAGTGLRTAIGVVRIGAVEPVDEPPSPTTTPAPPATLTAVP